MLSFAAVSFVTLSLSAANGDDPPPKGDPPKAKLAAMKAGIESTKDITKNPIEYSVKGSAGLTNTTGYTSYRLAFAIDRNDGTPQNPNWVGISLVSKSGTIVADPQTVYCDSISIPVPPAPGGKQYKCKVTGSLGNSAYTFPDDEAIITVFK
jgi:hypothetical protein